MLQLYLSWLYKSFRFFAEDLDGTLASSLVNTQLYVGSRINTNQKNVILNCIPLSKTAMLSSAIWKIQNQKWQNILRTTWSLRSICYYNLLQSFCEPYQPETATETLGITTCRWIRHGSQTWTFEPKRNSRIYIKGFHNALLYNVTDKDYLLHGSGNQLYGTFFFWTQDWENAIIR